MDRQTFSQIDVFVWASLETYTCWWADFKNYYYLVMGTQFFSKKHMLKNSSIINATNADRDSCYDF
jgi:hypothetical protein